MQRPIAPPPASRTFYDNNFDFLRCAMAVAVILSHSYLVVLGVEEAGPLGGLSSVHMDVGDIALNVFFIISGFLVTHSWCHTTGILDFAKRRALRIYPAFVVAMLFCAFVVAPAASDGTASPFSARQLARVAVQAVSLQQYGAPGMFATNPYPAKVNAAMWSIQYEWWCYVGLALVGAVGLLRRTRLLAVVLGCLLVVNWFEEHYRIMPELGAIDRFIGDPGAWTRLSALFLAGILFYQWRERIPHSGRLALVSAAIVLVSLTEPRIVTVLFPVFGSYLVFYVAFHPRVRLQRFGRYGDFSYGLYLYAFPIQQLIVAHLGNRVSPLEVFALTTLMTLPCAVASWHLVERRFLRLTRSTARRQPTDQLSPAGELVSV